MFSTAYEEFLAANAFQLAIILATLLTIFVPILWRRYESRRGMMFEILRAEVPSLGLPGLQVTYNGNSVPEAHICTFRISNTGKVPITQRDFEEKHPILVQFLGCHTHSHIPAKILGFTVEERTPSSLNPSLALTTDGRLNVEPMLWNPEDSVEIKVLLDHCFDREQVNVAARIEGLKQIQISKIPRSPRIAMFTALGLSIAGFSSFFLGFETLGLGWLAISTVAMTVVSLRLSRRRELMRRLALRNH